MAVGRELAARDIRTTDQISRKTETRTTTVMIPLTIGLRLVLMTVLVVPRGPEVVTTVPVMGCTPAGREFFTDCQATPSHQYWPSGEYCMGGDVLTERHDRLSHQYCPSGEYRICCGWKLMLLLLVEFGLAKDRARVTPDLLSPKSPHPCNPLPWVVVGLALLVVVVATTYVRRGGAARLEYAVPGATRRLERGALAARAPSLWTRLGPRFAAGDQGVVPESGISDRVARTDQATSRYRSRLQ
jgi:hypothetical protein